MASQCGVAQKHHVNWVVQIIEPRAIRIAEFTSYKLCFSLCTSVEFDISYFILLSYTVVCSLLVFVRTHTHDRMHKVANCSDLGGICIYALNARHQRPTYIKHQTIHFSADSWYLWIVKFAFRECLFISSDTKMKRQKNIHDADNAVKGNKAKRQKNTIESMNFFRRDGKWSETCTIWIWCE